MTLIVFFLFLIRIRSIRYIINGILYQGVFPVGCIYFSMRWKNSDISLDLRSREISNFPAHLEVNTADRKHTLP